MAAPWRPPALQSIDGISLGLDAPSGGTLLASHVQWTSAHRIIASECADARAFDRLGGPNDLDAFAMIADLTSPYVQAEMGNISLVPPADRIYGPGTNLIMTAFTYPGLPSRFSTGQQGTFYASQTEHTAIVETVFHRTKLLRETRSGPVSMPMTVLYVQLDAELVDIRNGHPRPADVYHVSDYQASQQFAALVRRLEGYGIVYDSVRDAGGECAAVFRPPALSHCSAVHALEYEWDGTRITVR